ncbi:unnamed protein product, partial [Closterium sp. NIES-64]
RAAPHSSQFSSDRGPVADASLDVWGPARVRGQGQERYFLLWYAAHRSTSTPGSLDRRPPQLCCGRGGWRCSAFRVWGSRAFVRDLSADKLSPRASPCVFLGFPPDAPGWQFYHPTSRRVLSSQDVTFDESVPYYRLFPYRTPSLPPPPLFLVDAVEPVEVTGDSGAAAGAEPGVRSLGAEPGVLSLGVRSLGVLGLGSGGAEPGGAEPGGAVPGGASSRREPLSPQELREWFARRWRRAAGAGGSSAAEGAAATRPGGARPVGAGAAGSEGSPGAGPAEDVGAEPAVGGPTDGAPGAAAGGSGASGGSAGGAAGVGAPAGGAGAVPAVSGVAARPRPYFVPLLQQVLGLTPPPPPLEGPQPVRSQPQLQPASPLPAPSPYAGPTGGLTERREPASRPASPVRTERASGRGSRQRPPPVLARTADSDSLRAASPTVTRLLATAVTDPSFESSAASALVTELVDFAARCRLDYAARLVAESESACPPSVGVSVPLAGRTYVDAVPPPGANIVSGMWIFRVKRPPGSPPVFKARYVARGFSQRQGVDYFQTFSPTPKMTTLRVLLHIAAQRDYELHSLDFSTAFLQGSLHEEIWLRRPPGFTGTFPPGTQWSLRRPVYGSRQAPQHMAAAKRVLRYLCSTSGMGLVLGGRSPVVLTGHADASWADDQATQRSSQGYTFSLGSGSVSWRSTRSSSVLGSSCEAEIYAGAMAAQELRWLTYLLTDLGELPRSPPVLYVDNKAMLALCREQRLEHRTKHIALRYFLARELQQRGQLRLAYVASEANTADVFHQGNCALRPSALL